MTGTPPMSKPRCDNKNTTVENHGWSSMARRVRYEVGRNWPNWCRSQDQEESDIWINFETRSREKAGTGGQFGSQRFGSLLKEKVTRAGEGCARKRTRRRSIRRKRSRKRLGRQTARGQRSNLRYVARVMRGDPRRRLAKGGERLGGGCWIHVSEEETEKSRRVDRRRVRSS